MRIQANNRNTYKLLPQQKAVYVTYSKNPQSLAYNMPARIRIPDGININKLKDSIINAVRHHKILFSHIESDGNELIGVYDNDVEIVFEQYDKNEIDNFVRPFDLSKSPLVILLRMERLLILFLKIYLENMRVKMSAMRK